MTIGRTDEPGTPLIATAHRCRPFVWGWFADPIWASGHMPRQQAGHMTALEPVVGFCCPPPLASEGPSTHAIGYWVGVPRGANTDVDGSRLAPLKEPTQLIGPKGPRPLAGFQGAAPLGGSKGGALPLDHAPARA